MADTVGVCSNPHTVPSFWISYEDEIIWSHCDEISETKLFNFHAKFKQNEIKSAKLIYMNPLSPKILDPPLLVGEPIYTAVLNEKIQFADENLFRTKNIIEFSLLEHTVYLL